MIISEENSKLSFCIDPKNHDELTNCLKSTYKIKNEYEIYNCTECNINYNLTYNKYTDTYFCRPMNEINQCSVLFCETCNNNNIFICEKCLSNYELNGLTDIV